ncbi:MAG: 50S ribosomal protein L20 [Bdellovibrionales bacterium GWB1_55_8]|nr:MAG: 50S ribosomal protein L20 [Bdellovibrionales bacterium GWB1_55_8]
MPRAKRGFKRRRRHNKILDRAEGFVLGRKNKIRRTAEAVDRAYIYSYRDRRVKKRDFRQLWIARISAAANNNDLSYNVLISALKKAQVALDRKILADIAIEDPATLTAIINQVRAA